MDVILEVFDTFVGDRVYAQLLPAFSPALKSHLASHNGSYSSLTQQHGAQAYMSTYKYQPSTQFLSLEPSDFAYMSQWPRDNMYRQALSLFFITWLFGAVIYFSLATLSYYLVFDPENFKHPKYIKNQVRLEINETVRGLHWIAIMTTPFFLAEVRGHSKLYDATADGPGRWYDFAQFPLFIAFTDFCIYWIHRGLHHPLVYKHFHKRHHKWVVPTPFASHAFHPLDGMAQGLPYHIYPLLFPLNKFAYIALFVFVNIWTVTIHDGEYAMNSKIINGAACHTMHHLYFNYNYGQFTTLWDRLGGSYRKPNEELFRREEKLSKQEMERQSKGAEKYIEEVEGEDDRTYVPEGETKKVQ